MKREKLFEPCYMEYKEYDKPVYYSEEFLKELAGVVNSTNLVFEEHLTESIGKVSNFTFTDGALYGDVNTEKALDGLKYSPGIDCSLVDKGEHWLAVNPTGLEDICLTTNPRQAKLMNTNDGGSNMSENNDNETIKILNNQVKDLNKQLAVAENKNKANEEKLKAYNDLEKEVNALREWKETNSKLIEEQKPIIEKYNAYQEKTRGELIDKLSNGNEEIKAKLKDKTLDELETQSELLGLHHHDQPPKGVGADNAPGLGEGSGETDEESEQAARNEAVEGMFGDLFTKED